MPLYEAHVRIVASVVSHLQRNASFGADVPTAYVERRIPGGYRPILRKQRKLLMLRRATTARRC